MKNKLNIQKTKDYDQFKQITGNRPTNRNHLVRLTAAIIANNRLEQNPIIVNENLEVIDGQHRLLVAKNNNLEIYYTIASNADLREVQMLNAVIKPWSLTDYLSSYIAVGNTDYLELKEFMSQNDLSIGNSMALLTNRYNIPYEKRFSTNNIFKSGQFKVTDREYANKMVDILNDMKRFCTQYAWRDRDMLQAIAKLEKQGADFNRLSERAEKSGKKIERQANTRGYIREIEDIYNYQSNRPVRFS